MYYKLVGGLTYLSQRPRLTATDLGGAVFSLRKDDFNWDLFVCDRLSFTFSGISDSYVSDNLEMTMTLEVGKTSDGASTQYKVTVEDNDYRYRGLLRYQSRGLVAWLVGCSQCGRNIYESFRRINLLVSFDMLILWSSYTPVQRAHPSVSYGRGCESLH